MPLTLAATLAPDRMGVRLGLSSFPASSATYTVSRRSPSGNVATVRGALDQAVAGATATVYDWEAPFDLPLVYTAEADDNTGALLETATASFTLTWHECEGWLTDLGRPTNSLPVTIESLKELDFAVSAGVHHVLSRRAPVFTTLPAWQPSTELIVLTEDELERDQVRAIWGAGYPFLLRTDPAFGVGNIYLGVTEFVEERILTDGRSWMRRFRANCQQVERPDPGIFEPIPPSLYQDVTAGYADYAAVKAAFVSYDEMLYTFPAGAGGDPNVPWLPDDV